MMFLFCEFNGGFFGGNILKLHVSFSGDQLTGE